MLNVLAGVLVGGKSSRFGRPKALEQLANGKAVIEHVVAVASHVADEVALLGIGLELPPSLHAYRRLADPPNAAGPIGGLHSLLTHAKNRWALMLACDLPLLREDVFDPLIQAVSDRADCDVVAYATGLQDRPVFTCCALYHPRILPKVERAIDGGQFRLQTVSNGSRAHSTPTPRTGPAGSTSPRRRSPRPV